jgi:hypothetical protein
MARMTLTQQLEEVQRQKAALEQRLQEEHFRVVNAQTTLDSFRDQVREKAIEVAKENNFCNGGLNEVLEELGLQPLPSVFTVEIEFTATQTVTVEISAEDLYEDQRDEDGVRSYVVSHADDFAGEASSYNWEVDENEIEIKSVTADTDS